MQLVVKKSKTIDEIAREIDEAQGGFGKPINSKSALEVMTVLACVDAIATACSVPDLHVMRDLGGGKKEKAKDLKIYRLLHRRPNEFQTAMEFRETLSMHSALTGDGLAIPVRKNGDPRGEILELLPVMPGQFVIHQPKRYQRFYDIHDEFGFVGRFEHDQVFHLRNRSWDRVRGLNAVSLAREAIGLAISTEANISALQKQGGKPGGIISTDQKLSSESVTRIKEAWQKGTTGKNAYKTPILDSGLKYYQMGMSAVDQQVLETRRFEVEEICRAFGVFPAIVMHADKTATFASAEAFFSAHSRLTAGKWQKNWGEKLDEFVLDGAGPLSAEFDNRLFDAASLKDEGEYFAKALGSGGAPGWMTANELRAIKGYPPIEGGDILYMPTNAIPGGEAKCIIFF